MSWSLAIFAILVAFGNVASQLIRKLPFADQSEVTWTFRKDVALTIGQARNASDPSSVALSSSINDSGYDPGTGSISIDLTFLGVAILIALVAAAFAIGGRLQRDTDGLV